MPLNYGAGPQPGVAGVPATGAQSQQTAQVLAQPQSLAPAPQQTALQAQLAQLQQQTNQPNLQAMQSVLSMMTPGQTPPPGLAQLMQPQMPAGPQMPGAANPMLQQSQQNLAGVQSAAPAASLIMPASTLGRP